MEIITAVIVVIVGLLLVKFWQQKRQQGSLPPGPKGVLTGLRFMKSLKDNQAFLTSEDWAKEYGDIVLVSILGNNSVFLNNAELIRQVMTGDQYKGYCDDRPPTFLGKYAVWNFKDIVMQSYTPEMKQERKMFHKSLHAYGEGIEVLEENVMAEISQMMKRMEKMGVIQMDRELKTGILNILHVTLTGEKVTDPSTSTDIMEEFDHHTNEMFVFDVNLVMTLFPAIRFVPGRYRRLWKKFLMLRDKLENHYYRRMKDTFQPGVVRGFIDGLLQQQRKIVETGSDWLTDQHLIAILINFIGAGYITTSMALGGFFLLMVKHPEVQQKIREEIEKVIGKGTPRLEDRPRMPFLEATILETLRYIRHVPFGIPHMTRADVTVDGFTIPAGTTIWVNLWLALHDKRAWNSPEEFQPERFLDNDGNLLSANDPVRRNMISFGIGRRQCAGESFAKNRMFLFTATLLQHFRFLPPPDGELPSTDSGTWNPGVILCPPPYFVTVKAC